MSNEGSYSGAALPTDIRGDRRQGKEGAEACNEAKLPPAAAKTSSSFSGPAENEDRIHQNTHTRNANMSMTKFSFLYFSHYTTPIFQPARVATPIFCI